MSYTMTGLAVAYDDVIDVNMQVWGDQWAVGNYELTARVILPEGAEESDVYVWGHPYDVDGSTSLGDDGVSPSLTAYDIPPERWVELRTAFPTDLLTSTDGARRVSGDGLDTILTEELRFAQENEAASRAAGIGLILGVAAIFLIAGGLGLWIYLRYGREPRVDYDREYEQAPPTDLTPSEVGALLSQGKVTEREFTATLFDLIRMGAINAAPTQVTSKTWGGLRTETVTDLELSLGDKTTGLRDFEQSVMTVIKRVLDDGPTPLTEFRDRIREDAEANARTYDVYQERVSDAITRSGMLDTSGNRAAFLTALVAAIMAVATWIILPRTLANLPGGAIAGVLIAIGAVIGAILLIAVIAFRKVRVRKTPEGALEAARWLAFKRYLTDFSRLEEAPAISLELWDRYLVYAIGFGIASEVLAQARLVAPPELADTSTIYWYGTYGLSGGSTENAFSGIQSALSGAFTPPSS
ncbi:hypothetical protein MNBD_ACTINO01-244, partial [hydrothermal vent metagenome]